MQQQVVRGEQHREHGDVVLPGQRLHPGAELVVELEELGGAVVGLHRRARPVGEQFERRDLPRQVFPPVLQHPPRLGPGQEAVPPVEEVQVAGPDRGQLRRPAGAQPVVDLEQLLDEGEGGDRVRDDVVDRLHQHPAVGGPSEQPQPHQRIPLQVVRPAVLRYQPGADLVPGQPGHIEKTGVGDGVGPHPLDRTPVLGGDVDAQTRMPGDQCPEGVEQQLRVELRAYLHRAADVVREAVRVELPEEPQGLLVVGEWVARLVGEQLHRRLRPRTPGRREHGQPRVQPLGQLAHRPVAEQRHHRQRDPQLGVGPGPQLHGEQRVQTERAEPGVRVDQLRPHPQHTRSEGREPLGHQRRTPRLVGGAERVEQSAALPRRDLPRRRGGERRHQRRRGGIPGQEHRPVHHRGHQQLGPVLPDHPLQDRHARIRRQ